MKQKNLVKMLLAGRIFQVVNAVAVNYGAASLRVTVSRLFQYFVHKTVKPQYFDFEDKRYRYFIHLLNGTFRNERAVEIPIVMDYVQSRSEQLILEVGNVLSNYFDFEHDIVDKYERETAVINQDVVQFRPNKKYDLIVSVSTLEHVGWDEKPRERNKILKALENLVSMLEDKGLIVVTMPLGYNHDVDSLLKNGALGFSATHFLKRMTHDNQWKQVAVEDVRDIRYDYPYQNANAIVVGIIEKAIKSR